MNNENAFIECKKAIQRMKWEERKLKWQLKEIEKAKMKALLILCGKKKLLKGSDKE